MQNASRRPGLRLAAIVAICAIGSVPLWSVVVIVPAVQAEFGTARAGAALPYTMTMVGFVFGGVLMAMGASLLMVDRVARST